MDDDADESATTPVQLALIFSHTTNYPDEPPLLNVKSLQGIQATDLKILREKLEQEATENLGMAMVYTLVTTAKEWLCERFCQDDSLQIKEEATAKEEYVYALDEGGHAVSFVRPWEISYLLIINMPTLHLAFAIENYVQIIVPHGEPVTVDTFLAWRERFEAELALQRAKLMPESALSTTKEKTIKGRQWFETGRAKGVAPVAEGSDGEDDEDIDFDDDELEDDEEDMLEYYLAEKPDSSLVN